MSSQKLSRRQVLGSVGAIVTGSAAGSALGGEAPVSQQQEEMLRESLLTPREDLVNILEYEAEAKKTLQPATFALIAGSDRALFDRITLRPRMNIPTTDLDLTANFFGEDHFAPIIVAPIAEQLRFHPDAELATARGAAAANALMIVSSRSSAPLAEIAALATPSFWYQVYASDSSARTQAQNAVRVGAKAIVITVGASHSANGSPTPQAIDWSAVDAIKQGMNVPVIVKGITTPDEAIAALQHEVQGIVASNFGGMLSSKDSLILALPSIVDAVEGSIPVLTDGSFRRGTDILKALAFGASGILLGRPVMWGLAAYGDAGVQGVIAMAQTELARYMAMSGKPNLQALDRTLVKVHGPLPANESNTYRGERQ